MMLSKLRPAYVPRHGVLAPVPCKRLVATSGIASAQTTFNAAVESHITRPVGCPDGADLCGESIIAGFGPAEYRLFVTGFTPTSQACGVHAATTTFTPQDASMLTLDEAGTVCGRGQTFVKGQKGYGNPRDANAGWAVQDGTGQFVGMTGIGLDSSAFLV